MRDSSLNQLLVHRALKEMTLLYNNMECELRYLGPTTFNMARRKRREGKGDVYDVRGDPVFAGLEVPIGRTCKHLTTQGGL